MRISSLAPAAVLLATVTVSAAPASAAPGVTSPHASCMAQGVASHAVLEPGAIAAQVAFIKSLPFVDQFGQVISDHARSADCGG
jgi:hypothetical protein